MNALTRVSQALRGHTDLADKERLLALTAGAGSILFGLRRGGALGIAAAAGGAWLAQAGLRKKTELTKEFTVRLTVGRPKQELYDFWHGFTQLPKVFQHVDEVREIGDGKTHWVMKTPGGVRLEWDSEVTRDIPGEEICWRTLPDSADIYNEGRVRFNEGPPGRGTEVELYLRYDAPGGLFSRAVGNFVNQATKEVAKSDLRRFKRLMESGEQPTEQQARTQQKPRPTVQ
ncbi:MAG: SRPBCC family protein [Natronospirillum sp.]